VTERALPRRRIEANGIAFGLVDEGEGPPVLLLHGFPDSADLWRYQVPVLVEAGYRAIAPDLRGFGETDRPEGVGEYVIPVVLEDVRALLAALGLAGEPVRLVTHDWGAVVGWLLAGAHPELVDRLVALSVGYPSKRPTLEELEKYWYVFLWQLEGTAERVIQRSDWRLMREWLREGRPGRSPDLERSLADLARPGALTAGLNWYRAFAQPEVLLEDELPLPPVACPVLAVWGEHDILPEARVTESEENVTGPWRYERFEGVGHWIPTEAPERLNPLLVEFLG
jgi:pimeloyl-ACP methyl ester carboxylesterase